MTVNNYVRATEIRSEVDILNTMLAIVADSKFYLGDAKYRAGIDMLKNDETFVEDFLTTIKEKLQTRRNELINEFENL